MLAQRSFEDLGTPLAEVTFCIVDLETTGGSPQDSKITEIGALKVKCGAVTGSFQSLVDPGEPVPSFIRLLTGISDDMLFDAPPIEEVLPNFIEFLGGSVLVAHNARFDVSFLNAALARNDYPTITNQIVDTAQLARRILQGEVRNNKLETLAYHLRCAHKPCHRAYADVLATTDVLHNLIERVAGFGVTTLDDLLSMSSARIDGTFSKIRLTDDLPRSPGVYRFLDGGGRTLYVGKATDLRARVRSYFYGDPRSGIRNLLKETQGLSFDQHESVIEAEVAEARYIAEHQPPYNRRGKKRSSWYLKVEHRKRVPRMAAARKPQPDGSLYVGPFTSSRTVRTLIDAFRTGSGIHRCTNPARCRGCGFEEIGICPGSGGQREEIRRAAEAILCSPASAAGRIAHKMHVLAQAERFEEAAEVRGRGALLEDFLIRSIRLRALLDAGRIVLGTGGRMFLIVRGRMVAAVQLEDGDPSAAAERLLASYPVGPVPAFMTPDAAAEAGLLDAWIERSGDLALLAVDGSWAHPVGCRSGGAFKAPKGRRSGDLTYAGDAVEQSPDRRRSRTRSRSSLG
jgi:DNA polymerase-3 subunit epsilon